jgi:hypothetical protein
MLAIPCAVAQYMGIQRDSLVDVDVENGRLVALPASEDVCEAHARASWEAILKLADEASQEGRVKMPSDASINYKHYLYGSPRRT